MRRFEMTEAHVAVACRLCFYTEDTGYEPVPVVDWKRPLGNSGGAWRDVVEICGWPQWEDDDGERHWPKGIREKAQAIFADMETVLTIILRTRSFEPGVYVSGDYDDRWQGPVAAKGDV